MKNNPSQISLGVRFIEHHDLYSQLMSFKPDLMLTFYFDNTTNSSSRISEEAKACLARVLFLFLYLKEECKRN